MNQKLSDGVVDGDVIHEAVIAFGRMDPDDALNWLRQREDTLGVFIRRESDGVLPALEQHGAINENHRRTLCRIVISTAVVAVAAVLSGHYRLWSDLMYGTPLTHLDPLLAVRRRITVVPQEPKRRGTRKPGGASRPALSGTFDVTRFAFVRCVPVVEAEPKLRRLLLTTVGRDGNHRHQTMNRADGEALLKDLVDGLSKIGSTLGQAAWKTVCEPDPRFDAPPNQPMPPNSDGDAGAPAA